MTSRRTATPPFPYQTTADQWFDRSRFESYRKLGPFTMDRLTGLDTADAGGTIEALLTRPEDHRYG